MIGTFGSNLRPLRTPSTQDHLQQLCTEIPKNIFSTLNKPVLLQYYTLLLFSWHFVPLLLLVITANSFMAATSTTTQTAAAAATTATTTESYRIYFLPCAPGLWRFTSSLSGSTGSPPGACAWRSAAADEDLLKHGV